MEGSKKVSGGWGGVVDFLNIVSTPGPVLSRSRLGLVRLVTRLSLARFGQLGDQIDQAEDQVCQGQGQKLDNKCYNKDQNCSTVLHFLNVAFSNCFRRIKVSIRSQRCTYSSVLVS